MRSSQVYNALSQNKKQLAVLVDPETFHPDYFEKICLLASEGCMDFIFVGGSLLSDDQLELWLEKMKANIRLPLVLFPGNIMQISPTADALLFLSLISGRNPEMLIGKHIIAAPYLKKNGMEVIPTGYMLIDSGKPTTAQYMSHTLPIPHDKDAIAVCTALAGEMLGLKLIYMDAGSGASLTVSSTMIKSVKDNISIPLIVGGGISNPEMAMKACAAGADVVVVGNAAEKDPDIIKAIGQAVHSLNF